MFFQTLCLMLLVVVPGIIGDENAILIGKEQASQYLHRTKRANEVFEEFSQGNAERECYEETCNYEEAREVFENDQETVRFWANLTRQCETFQYCNKDGILRCENKYNGYRCVCKSGYVGNLCETDVNECDLGFCPPGTTCEDRVNAFACLCPEEGCQAIQQQIAD